MGVWVIEKYTAMAMQDLTISDILYFILQLRPSLWTCHHAFQYMHNRLHACATNELLITRKCLLLEKI